MLGRDAGSTIVTHVRKLRLSIGQVANLMMDVKRTVTHGGSLVDSGARSCVVIGNGRGRHRGAAHSGIQIAAIRPEGVPPEPGQQRTPRAIHPLDDVRLINATRN